MEMTWSEPGGACINDSEFIVIVAYRIVFGLSLIQTHLTFYLEQTGDQLAEQ